ncbi:MAG: FkbM family methyltransferase [Myxococcales bacterium]|nr:FkbM family methyltransferase [Myxococcales bacterium]MDH5567146.1 FkbM family methyltransferase [Myxococcales bacterium]
MRGEDLRDYLELRRHACNPWEIVRFRKTKRPDRALRVDWRDGRPPLHVPGAGLQFHVFHRIFLRDEYRLGRHAGRRWRCVLDLGANAGFFTARIAPSADRVVAYEPVAEHFELLARNVKDFAHVTAVHAGVAGRRREIRVDPGTGTHVADGGGGEAARAVPLAAVFREHAIDVCDLLKIDVEGMEYEILYGADADVLARIERIYGEYHAVRSGSREACIDALESYLRAHGFAIERVAHRRKAGHGMFFAERSAPRDPGARRARRSA